MYYFASDVHLGGGDENASRRAEERFVKWLESIAEDATAIFLVGDIFDFWFEYGKVVPKGFVRTLGKLAELSDRGVKIYFFTGNHDMWARDYFEHECGMEIVRQPRTYTLAGKNIFIAHGDNMNISGMPLLQLMNWGFRSTFLRKIFSWVVHPDLALRFGQWWSNKSRKSHANDNITPESLGFLIDYAREYKEKNPNTDYILFGHMHYPYDMSEGELRLLFLGCWEDTTKTSYAVMDDQGNIALKTF